MRQLRSLAILVLFGLALVVAMVGQVGGSDEWLAETQIDTTTETVVQVDNDSTIRFASR